VVVVGVLELVEGEPLAAGEQVAVVGGECVVDAGAEEHVPARWGALAEQVVAAPVVGAEQELRVGGVREVAQPLAVVADGELARDLDAGGELGAREGARRRRRGCGEGGDVAPFGA
jgi:hypothetical protein